MNDLQTINDIVSESVRSSSYITVIISSSIFILYTIIIKLVDYFKAKHRSKPLIEMANAIKENTANIVKLNSVLDKTLKDAERKQAKHFENTINLVFDSFGFEISREISDIIAHNNIEANKSLISENIAKFTSTEYYKIYSILSTYELGDINGASKLKEEWIQEIIDNVLVILYNGQDAITRIVQIQNKLNILIDGYKTYIINKIFNT